MSEIKCRVWYEDEMIYSDNYATGEYNFSFDAAGEMLFLVWNDELHKLTPDGDETYAGWDPYTYDIELYTGLKDCGGKEIYEGDIVIMFAPNFKDVVIFEYGAFGYRSHIGPFITFAENHNFNWNNGASKKIKVVGNIHENKDLLNGK